MSTRLLDLFCLLITALAGARQRTKMVMRARLLAFSIFLLLCLSTKIFGAELEGQRLHIGYSIYAGITAPLWATKEAGLFERNGLQAQLVYLRGGIEAAQALITGDIPFALMGARRGDCLQPCRVG